MLPQRKHPRLKRFDYSSPHRYFVTVCAYQRQLLFSRIFASPDLNPGKNELTDCGKIIEKQIFDLEKRFSTVKIETFVIMPNHLHLLIRLSPLEPEQEEKRKENGLPAVICTLKSLVVRDCRENGITTRIFQTSFHDHIIRSEAEYTKIWRYIESNPQKWESDCFFRLD